MFLGFHSAVSAKIMQVNVSHVQAHFKTVLHVFQKSLLDMFARCVWGLTFMKIVFLDTQRFHLAGIAFGQKM